jgi:hypothetical protein
VAVVLSKYGWLIQSGQKYVASDHEKSSRDQDLEVESSETGFQVGHPQNVRKEASASGWFSDHPARSIPPPGFISR